ncbi:MAG: CHAT domain-containing protein [Saprospiraceae bacterium]
MPNTLSFRNAFSVLLFALFLPAAALTAQDRCRPLRDSVEKYINNGQYYKAEQLAKAGRLMDICREEFGEQDTVFASVLGSFGTLRYYRSDYPGAMEFNRRADSIYLRTGDTTVHDYGAVCNNYAVLYQRLGQMPLAEQYARRALGISALNGDSISSRYINRLNTLAAILIEQGKHREGLPILKNALRVSEQTADTASQTYIALALSLTRAYDAVGLYDSSLIAIEKLLPIGEKVWEKHPFRAVLWISRGNARYRLGRYILALDDFKRAQALCDTQNYFYAEALNGQGLCYTAMGRYDLALKLETEGLELAQRFMGKDYANLSSFWNNIGFIHYVKGNIESALPAYLEGQRIFEKNVRKTQRNVLDLQNNIGVFYTEQGFFEQGLAVLLETERNSQKEYDMDNFYYAQVLGNLAVAYAYLGIRDSSKEKSLRSLQVYQQFAKGSTKEIALGLYNVSAEYYASGKLDSALVYAQKSLTAFQACGDTTGIIYGRVLNSLKTIHYDAKQRRTASAYNALAIAQLKANPHPNNPQYTQHICSAALSTDWLGAPKKALPLFLLTDSLLDAQTDRIAGLYGYGADEAFARNFTPQYDHIAAFLLRYRRRFPQAAEILYDNALALSHLLLHQTRSALESARNSPDSATAALARHWNDLRQLVVNQSAKARPDYPLDSLERELTATESRLTATYLPLAHARKKTTWRDVQAALAPDDAAVEFLRVPSERDSSTRYVALVVRPGLRRPEIADLCDEATLAALLERRVRSLPHTIASQYRARANGRKTAASEFHDLLWRPLEKQLRGVRRVFFAPAGLLNQVSFAAVEDAGGRVLADRFVLGQMTSTRELAFPRPLLPGSAVRSALLVGGVQYHCDSAQLAEAARQNTCESPASALLPDVVMAKTRRADISDFLPPGTRGGSSCGDTLPGTAREQAALAGLLGERGTPYEAVSGSNAVEQRLKCYRHSGPKPPGLLHVGTHGIYLPTEGKKPIRPGENAFRWAENPMFRSYLVLAGGGEACGSGQIPLGTRDDGLLTAYEVAALNFEGTQLVTLSACVSALGDVRDAEGVYGLQRAFKIAGARHLLLTLWPVDDAATEAFMGDFYHRWLTENMDIREAFRQTQATFRAKEKWAHPYYWAGFVLI